MARPEILAPAGGREQFMAAIAAGADAVYLGLKEFNARARAANFSLEELASILPVARKANVKVLVTLNVLIKQSEIARLIDILSELEWLGVYAVIVQDLGAAALIRAHFPGLRLHASTQMAVHNEEGVHQASKLGFRRVVLARELTVREISRIRSAFTPDVMEIEVFCHGSLCYSYSGLCFFSGAEDARSGNRGECAYTCRKPYKIIGEPGFGFLFSMRDLDTSDMVEELAAAGVDALKIEGRKKDAQFVASSVGLYRTKLGRRGLSLEPQSERDFAHDLDYSYQRETTSFFLKGRYYENVIDLDNPTHKGSLAGIIRRVKGREISFRTSVHLESHDGIRIDRPEKRYHAEPQHGQTVDGSFDSAQKVYRNEVCEFSLRDMTIRGERTYQAKPQNEITVTIPPGLPLPEEGDLVFKVRSNELKRHVESLVKKAEALERQRPLKKTALIFDARAEEGFLTLTAQASHNQSIFARAGMRIPAERARTPALHADIHAHFTILGDAGFECEIQINADETWFVPRSLLKDLRRNLTAEMERGQAALVEETRKAAASSISPIVKRARSAARFQIKVDRLESLEFIRSFEKEFNLTEIVFEPKRMFTGRRSGRELIEEIQTRMPRTALRIALPVVLRTWDRPGLHDLLSCAAEAGLSFEAANVGALHMLRPFGRPVSGDFTLYALNAEAARDLHAQGIEKLAVSVEDDFANLRAHLPRWPIALVPQAIVYKDTPLFIAEACSLTALHNGCPTSRVCGYRTLEIENDEGERFYVAHEQCKSVVYGKRAYSITSRITELQNLGVSDFRLDFLTRPYSEEQIHTVIDAALRAAALPHTHEANFARALL